METKCVHYSREYVGQPCIQPLDRDDCAVADGTGHLAIVNLRSQEVRSKLFVGVVGGHSGCKLRSLRRNPAQPRTVAVATRGGYAVICDFDRQAVEKVFPVQGGTVNAVAFSPDGRYLAIGTGSYPLSGDAHPAHVELWMRSDDEGLRFVTFAALPGVCVDAIAWEPDGDLIACATGLRSQKSGFIAQLGADDLRPQSFFETPWSAAGRLCYVDLDSPRSHLAVNFRGAFRVVGSGDGKEAWRVDRPDAPDVLQDFDVDPQGRAIVLTSGAILDVGDGAEKARFLAMKDLTSIAVRPGGGYLGACGRGRVYCWA